MTTPLIVSMFSLVGIVVLVNGVLLWRAIEVNAKLAGTRTRADERDRRDMHDMIIRLIEKRDIDPIPAATLHAQERRARVSTDAQTEQRANNHPPLVPAGVGEPDYMTPQL